MITVQTHAAMTEGFPLPCGCRLGYHHHPTGEPVVERADGKVIKRIGRHPYCVGACKIWPTPTEEFDFVLVSGNRVGLSRITTGVRVIDHTNPHRWVVSWDNDALDACSSLGVARRAEWKRLQERSASS